MFKLGPPNKSSDQIKINATNEGKSNWLVKYHQSILSLPSKVSWARADNKKEIKNNVCLGYGSAYLSQNNEKTILNLNQII